MKEFIYVRISNTERVIEFAEDWQDISYKSGIKKKFPVNKQYKIISYVMEHWKKFTVGEVEKWTSPKWLKDIYNKTLKTPKLYITVNDDDSYLVKFDIESIEMKIQKPPIFFEVYDRYLYLYEKILFLVKTLGYSRAEIYTDLVELLKLNRIYWNNYNEVDLYVHIRNMTIGGGKAYERYR